MCLSLHELPPYLGFSFIISAAYMDSGNWAIDISDSTKLGPVLL